MNQSHAGGPAGAGPQPSEEELRAQLEAELRRLKVDDLLLQTLVSLINLGARRAGLAGGGPDEVDLTQVRTAVDAAQALLEVLERGDPPDLRPLRDALAQLQMAYARAAGDQGATAGGESEQPGAAPPEQDREPDDADRQRRPGPAQSSGRLWIPGD